MHNNDAPFSRSNLLEEELALAAKTDEKAFSALYEIYLPKIFAYVTRRISDRDEAEDLTSNIFLKVVENIGSFNPQKAKFKTWIYMITTRMMIDYFRARKKRAEGGIEEAEKIESAEKNPHEQAKSSDERRMVFDAVSKLKDRHQQVLMLKFWSGLTMPEMAEALAVTENNAGVILHRAINDFKITYQAEPQRGLSS